MSAFDQMADEMLGKRQEQEQQISSAFYDEDDDDYEGDDEPRSVKNKRNAKQEEKITRNYTKITRKQ